MPVRPGVFTAAERRNLFFEKILDKSQNADNVEDHLRSAGNNRERHVKSHHKYFSFSVRIVVRPAAYTIK
jgi:hypothetical protein